MYLDLIGNTNEELSVGFINSRLDCVFVTTNNFLFMMRPKAKIQNGIPLTDVLNFFKLLTNGKFSKEEELGVDAYGTHTRGNTQILEWQLNSELFSSKTEFKEGDEVLAISTTYIPPYEGDSAGPYLVDLNHNSILVGNHPLVVTKCLGNHVYLVNFINPGNKVPVPFKILGEVICHRMEVVPFLI